MALAIGLLWLVLVILAASWGEKGTRFSLSEPPAARQ